MAITFSVRLPSPPDATHLREVAGEDTLAGLDAVPDPWEVGGVTHVWLPGVSVRSLELEWDGRDLHLRVPACACREDLHLAVWIVATLARQAKVPVRPEGLGELDADRFLSEYGPEWIEDIVEDSYRKLPGMFGESMVIMPAATRDLHVGPGMLARLGTTAPAPWIALFRQVLYPDPRWFRPTAMRIRDDAGRTCSLAVLAPGVAYHVGRADVASLGGLDGGPRYLALARVPELFPRHATRLDEVCFTLEAVDEATWTETLGGLGSELHQDPFAALPPKPASTPPRGTLLPVLRPPSWQHRDRGRCRPLTSAPPADQELVPLVSWGWDTPTMVSIVLRDAPADHPYANDPDGLEREAVANLEALDLPFREELHDGELVGLTALGEYASELVLSKRRMAEAAARLGGAPALVVAMPVKGALRVYPVTSPHLGALAAWSHQVFTEAGRTSSGPRPLSPILYGVFDGQVNGILKATFADQDGAVTGSGVLPSAAPAAPTPRRTGQLVGAAVGVLLGLAVLWWLLGG